MKRVQDNKEPMNARMEYRLLNYYKYTKHIHKCTRSQAIRGVDEFVSSSDLEKFSITHHLVTNGCEWVPSE